MKNNWIFIFLAYLLFSSCGFTVGYTVKDLSKDIQTYSRDKDVSKEEFKKLTENILNSEDEKLEQFKDDQKLYSYIIKYLSSSKINAKVWNPNPLEDLKPFNVNVFLENSASMDGYVAGASEFKNTIYSMLGNLRTSNLDSLNLFYINSKVIINKEKSLPKDSEDFIKKLNPTTFKLKGGNRANSDLAEVIKSVISRANDKNACILISDFIFSQGKTKNGENDLGIQKVTIDNNIKDKLKKQSLALAIYQLASNFNGYYYDFTDNPSEFNGRRPYFVWIIGTEKQVQSIIDQQVIRNSDQAILRKAAFKSTENKEKAEIRILRDLRIGNFTSLKNEIINNVEDVNGEFAFSFAANFNESLRDLNYFSDSKNYIPPVNYSLKVREITKEEQTRADLTGYSHIITLNTKKLTPQQLTIKIVSKTPAWVYDSSSNNDSDIQNNKDEQKKTFGLKFLIEGVSNAFNFYPEPDKNIISEFNITINK
jgi:hypothetical protein